jgi:hypothetical protein
VGDLVIGGGKSFRIDHPFEPENKYLFHFCLESNEVLNIYRGNVVLDSEGEASIQLPEYFQAINIDYSYQLTAIGASASGLYVSHEIENNRFSIAGGKPGLKVSWQVTGVRNDAYFRTHPEKRQVEREKLPQHKGLYLHPESFGKDKSKAIHKGPENNNIIELEKAPKGDVIKSGFNESKNQ